MYIESNIFLQILLNIYCYSEITLTNELIYDLTSVKSESFLFIIQYVQEVVTHLN